MEDMQKTGQSSLKGQLFVESEQDANWWKEALFDTEYDDWEENEAKKKFNKQNYHFRNFVKTHLFWILYGELAFLAALIILQGFHLFKFNINDWVFGTFANATIVQTFFLIRCIVNHLFPK